jgi:hypothetical protein
LSIDRGSWRWQALIMQPEPIDAELIAAATAEAVTKKDLPGLARLDYIRWAEGRCAQLLHIGPYAAEAPSIVALHEAIAAAGYRPRSRGFVGQDTYTIDTLYADLHRFVFLLGLNDGQQLFGDPTP